MNEIEGKTFTDETVVLDYTTYRDCTLQDCDIVYHGQGPVGLVGCTFDNCEWQFSDAASNTLGFMAMMHQHGGGARDIVEQTFNNIREGRYQ